MRRQKMKRSIDKKVFKRTAVKVRKANLIGGVMRGGIRL